MDSFHARLARPSILPYRRAGQSDDSRMDSLAALVRVEVCDFPRFDRSPEPFGLGLGAT